MVNPWMCFTEGLKLYTGVAFLDLQAWSLGFSGATGMCWYEKVACGEGDSDTATLGQHLLPC